MIQLEVFVHCFTNPIYVVLCFIQSKQRYGWRCHNIRARHSYGKCYDLRWKLRDYDLWGKLKDYDLRYNAYDLRYKGYDLRNKLRVKSYNSKNHLCMQFLLYKSITKILKTIFIDDVKWMSHCDYQK